MTARPLVVIGAGGFGREVLDVVEAINAALDGPRWQVRGVVDDAPSSADLARLAARSIPHLGSLDEWLRKAPKDVSVVIGVGSPAARRGIAERIDTARTTTYPELVHPRAYIGSQVRLGAGTVICAGVQVSTNVCAGRHVHINPNATIGHDTLIGDFVSVNPAATVSGSCVIRTQSLVGAGAVVLQGLEVGSRSTIGASACVVSDVQPDAIVKGVPAR